MLVSKNPKICITPDAKPKICVIPPTQTSNGSQWNVGCVGSPGIGARVGHVRLMLFVSISFALGSQRKRGFQWRYRLYSHCNKLACMIRKPTRLYYSKG